VKAERILMPACAAALIYVSGCTAVQVSGDVQAGRNALQTGRPADAIDYLKRAADLNPNYKTPYRVQAGVLAYLGRAYYETGNDAEALPTLEKAVSIDKDDALAHLYLGLTLLRSGDRQRGRTEIEAGLKAIEETLDYIATDWVSGINWDPNREIRSGIARTLSAKLDDAELAMAGERIGILTDEEIEKARRDEDRGRSGGGAGDGM
jgi:tetratricopeptide (TPR) repeat protein